MNYVDVLSEVSLMVIGAVLAQGRIGMGRAAFMCI